MTFKLKNYKNLFFIFVTNFFASEIVFKLNILFNYFFSTSVILADDTPYFIFTYLQQINDGMRRRRKKDHNYHK